MLFEGKLNGEDKNYMIIASRFNASIVDKLVEGALDCLYRHAVTEARVDLCKVPGAFEIPLVAKKIAEQAKYDVIICLGAVIRGETPHFDYVASEVSKGIAAVSLDKSVPIIFGVLTTDSYDQAVDRAGGKAGNKGWDAAMTALEMASLWDSI
jgi:6,7-dimethyl-8-ribityllumazine synthase